MRARDVMKTYLRADLARMELTVIRESLAYGEAYQKGLEQAAALHKSRHEAAVKRRDGMRRRLKDLYEEQYFTWEYRAPSAGQRPVEEG